MDEDRTHPQGPDRAKFVRIIGIELTSIPANGNGRREELQMFSLERDLPFVDMYGGGVGRPMLQITVHTSEGDKQATVYL